MLNDLRLAIRGLRRAPGFTAAVVLTLALGIGANTAVFTVINAVLVRSLPYAHPDRVVQLLGRDTRGGDDRGTISYANFLDWRAEARSFSAMAAYDEWAPTMEGADGPVRVVGASVSASYFSVLGVRPAAGRFFTPDEEPPGTAHAVVLSYALWSTRFGADPALIGATVRLSGVPYTVVGVAPRALEDPRLSGPTEAGPQVWRVSPAYFGADATNRSGHAYTAIARLGPGVSLERAQAELSTVAARLAALYPATNAHRTVRLTPIIEHLVGRVRRALLLVFAVAALVLLVACANTANLVSARASTRQGDVALRAALGASRGRLAVQALIESAVLAVLGAAAGVALAYYATGALQLLARGELPRLEQVRVDGATLLFALGAAALTAAVSGIVPLLGARRADLRTALTAQSSRGGETVALQRRRAALVAGEVALATVALVAAGLLTRSLWKLRHVDPGFTPGAVLTLRVGVPPGRYHGDAALGEAYGRIFDAASKVPGVAAAGATSILPMSGHFNGMGFAVAGRAPASGGAGPEAETRAVTPGYFAALGMRLVRGRGLTDRDAADAPGVVVINQLAASRFWPGRDPLGSRVTLLDASREVVGIVRDVRQFSPALAPEPAVYMPLAQAPAWMWTPPVLALRTSGDPGLAAPAVRAALRTAEPGLVISEVRPLDDVVAATVAAPRFYAVLVVLFGLMALTLGIVGVYGVVSLGVARRTHEFGIRMVLGARNGQILGSAFRSGAAPAIGGLALGLGGGAAAGRAMASLLFGVGTVDLPTLVGVAAVLAASSAIAAYLPARRAARVDPAEALRYE